ncbi:hypothetical protein GOZ96_04925 [Agrobacterium vitis]|uniref:DUF6745 domain-containing protein n=1 Tax=Agrobacterium vitis TaxID=373 RepID=UPI0012E8D661|nr:hypothetical protein [Agrobacterium vitis]MUZ95932.1 hypothetical protein [Agrobacterium vitis]
MAKIERMTEAQEKRLVEFREEWLKVGMCCEPADFEAGDEVIRGFYARIGKPAPMILHFSSPAMCELAANVVMGLLKDKPVQLRDQLRDQLVGQLRDQLRDQLGGQLGGQLRDQLWDQLGGQLWDQLGGQLRDQLWGQLRDAKNENVFLSNSFDNQYNVAWGAFYLFGHEIGVEYKADNIALLLEWGRLFKSVGWWAPFEGVCFVSDRPRKVTFDDQKRLHGETGKAVEYSDGWGVSAWHGTRIPDEWLANKSSITAKTALTWENIEQRRAACEIVGWAKILRELDAKVIDTDGDPLIGTLVEVRLPDLDRPARFCRVQCGTGREFAIGVPPEINTALQAQAWIIGVQPSEFIRPEVRT